MVKKYPDYSVSWRIPHSLREKLNQRKKSRQPLAGVIEDIFQEIEDMHKLHDPLIDKISKLENSLDYYERQDITVELIERLVKLQHPRQTVGGVIEELIGTAEKVRRGELFIYEKPYALLSCLQYSFLTSLFS